MLNKPIYVGFTVLELRTNWIITSWINTSCMTFIITLSRQKLMLIYCLLIQTVLPMKWNKKMSSKNYFKYDSSEYKSNFFDSTNKKELLGKLKMNVKESQSINLLD